MDLIKLIIDYKKLLESTIEFGEANNLGISQTKKELEELEKKISKHNRDILKGLGIVGGCLDNGKSEVCPSNLAGFLEDRQYMWDDYDMVYEGQDLIDTQIKEDKEFLEVFLK